MIRAGKHTDLAQIMTLANRVGDLSPYYRGIPRDRQGMVQTVTQCIASQFGCCLVAENDGRLTGVLLAQAVELWFSKCRTATDLLFYSEIAGDGFRMAKAYSAWAWSVPRVCEVTMAQSTGLDIERTTRLLRLAGFEHVGGVFTQLKNPTAATESPHERTG